MRRSAFDGEAQRTPKVLSTPVEGASHARERGPAAAGSRMPPAAVIGDVRVKPGTDAPGTVPVRGPFRAPHGHLL
ncbi:hypothetical protein GCM10018953_44820 [Streptosporangium nondiastaticum]